MMDSNFTEIAHDDHGLAEEHINYLMSTPLLANYKEGEFICAVIDLPIGLPDLFCALHGPCVGDDPVPDDAVKMVRRAGRTGLSRMVARTVRPAHGLVVIGLKGGVCFTAYGTRSFDVSPMEPWDAERKHGEGSDEHIKARDFWAVHALSHHA